MQEPDGSMRILGIEEMKANPNLVLNPKVIQEDKYFKVNFKVNHCFFKITKITPEGIEAKGVSRREYFENRR